MNRSILNFEAMVHCSGRDDSGQDVYTVQLLMNHHVVKCWTMGLREGYLLTQDRASLDRFVAARLHELLNPVTIRVVDVNP